MEHLMTEIYAGVYLGGAPAQPQYRSLENPNLPLNDPAVWESVFGDSYGTDSGISVTAEKSLMYAPLWYGVSMISDDVARLSRPVYVRRPEIGDDARERDRGHRLNYILNVAANEETEAIKFWGRIMVHALLWGNGYAYIVRDGTGSPAELVNLLPDRTTLERTSSGQLFYVTEVSTDRGPKLQALLPEDVLHIEGLNYTRGAAAVVFRMARNSIALGLAQENFASKFFKNGGRIGGILELPIGMPKGARDTLEEGFRKTYEGGDNPFKTVVLRDNAKFHAGQFTPQGSQMVEASESQTRMIGYWLKLLPSKFGLTNSFSYNSKAEDNQHYLDTTLSIWLARIESACNFKLISSRQADSHFVEHNTSALLKMDLAKRADAYTKLIAARVMNPNEVRAKENMLPYDGGDEFVNPNTMKSGDDSQAEPKEDKPKETPKRDAAYLRVLFGITASARDKAKNPNAFFVWLDGNLAKHRADWVHLWGDRPFPFNAAIADFRKAAEHYPEDKLPTAIDSICNQLEAV